MTTFARCSKPTPFARLVATLALVLAVTAGTLDAAPAHAQTSGAFAAESAPNAQDYRGRVVTAVTLMFIFIIGFVVWSQRQGSTMREELDHLKRRIDELEAKKT